MPLFKWHFLFLIRLSKMQMVNLFVYGSLKRGYQNHSLLKSCCDGDIISGTIKGTLYDIHMGFPALQLKGNYTIQGQLAQIPKQYLKYFDQFEGVPTYYQRETVQVKTENGEIKEAYVYTMRVLPFGASIIGSGNW